MSYPSQAVMDIIGAAGEAFSVRPDQLLSSSRSRSTARARQLAMYLLRTEMRMTMYEIGQLLSRDHSSVVYGVKAVKGFLKSDEWFGRRVAWARAYLRARELEPASLVVGEREANNNLHGESVCPSPAIQRSEQRKSLH